MNLKVSQSTLIDGVKIILLKGRFDASAVDEVEAFLMNLIRKNELPFILDMSLVSYIGSSGLRVLLSLNQELKAISQRYAIINLPASGKKIIQAMEIDKLFHIFPGEKEAAEFFNQKI